ncbi:MAG: L-rhamnose mutarotase [Verrucomicrobia bacterium]|nr:L-rhamnose mutarotase [Verrucomicrobiota bacterium]
MIRRAFVMSVNPGAEAEYERRHRPVWPELEAVLLRQGVTRYSIFLEPDSRQLFAYVEFTDEAQWDAIAATPECRRWWRHMRDLMPTDAEDRPTSRALREVFHLARGSGAH